MRQQRGPVLRRALAALDRAVEDPRARLVALRILVLRNLPQCVAILLLLRRLVRLHLLLLASRARPLVRFRNLGEMETLEMVRAITPAVAQNQIASVATDAADLLLHVNRLEEHNERHLLFVHQRFHLLHVDYA